jgi:hypothetical protein
MIIIANIKNNINPAPSETAINNIETTIIPPNIAPKVPK